MPGDNKFTTATPIIKTIEEENIKGTFDETSSFDSIDETTKTAVMNQLKVAKEKAGNDVEAYRKNLLDVLEYLEREDAPNSKAAAEILTKNIEAMTEVFAESHQEIAA